MTSVRAGVDLKLEALSGDEYCHDANASLDLHKSAAWDVRRRDTTAESAQPAEETWSEDQNNAGTSSPEERLEESLGGSTEKEHLTSSRQFACDVNSTTSSQRGASETPGEEEAVGLRKNAERKTSLEAAVTSGEKKETARAEEEGHIQPRKKKDGHSMEPEKEKRDAHPKGDDGNEKYAREPSTPHPPLQKKKSRGWEAASRETRRTKEEKEGKKIQKEESTGRRRRKAKLQLKELESHASVPSHEEQAEDQEKE
ncbi:cyclic nucleotide-gated cation channel beta-1-like [Entelurus aequoreus]|uniref:cyclic nucleotide-gated cation channel beta-1-like n=1 Tax=Entelurus aequoreus TaxID=161455 RepID=UPI002B1E48CC|nr:cyclic nucleotide-gated cation channel beta-1-like [Entelurus aequoreus]